MSTSFTRPLPSIVPITWERGDEGRAASRGEGEWKENRGEGSKEGGETIANHWRGWGRRREGAEVEGDDGRQKGWAGGEGLICRDLS